jgi:cell pole-organizing protein PopZ
MSETPPAAAATPDGADPSMEDILASIRRILNEEEAPAEAAAPVEAPADDDVLVLDESMMVSAGKHSLDPIETEPEPEPPVRKIELPVAHVEPPAIEPEPSVKDVAAAASNQAHPMEAPPKLADLMAPETAAAATSLVGNLVRSLSAGRATKVYSGGPTLEDLVRAELRPLLKEWLDTNLPPLVERLVRTEIERVVGRAVP